ncbi:AraC family transcriptional regulator [Chryseobacterium antibioticum]|uniref:AraC family transcriptional regulator n=1 Tax=Chryseobacterium pyrolae TaxID=2987481 RepID=A0ABT2IBL2_9FLAO|nr:AraC family transcriptional regulator [Chryseobacterium pyrolae]MCT2406011.1 AraC family transcriptional regulator [Chryseobacterium pyrolae]
MKKYYPVKNMVHLHLITGSLFVSIVMLNFWKYSVSSSTWLLPVPFAAYVFLERKYTYIYCVYITLIILSVNLLYKDLGLEFFKFSEEKYLVISDSFVVVANIITFMLLLYCHEKINKMEKENSFIAKDDQSLNNSLHLIKENTDEQGNDINEDDIALTHVFTERFDLKEVRSELQSEVKEVSSKDIEKYNLLFQKIIDYIETEKPYKDVNFSISELAFAIKTNSLYISTAIKQNGYSSFNHFTNSYRINKVKKLIAENDLNKVTLMYIYTECGFSNQATFNRVFKKVEGITPSEYINRLNSM